jgi:Immunoglobulin domain
MRSKAILAIFGLALLFAAGCGGSGSGVSNSSSGSPSGSNPSGSAAPAITSQPSSETVTVGQSASFSVIAAGTPAPTYQWQKNSVNIAQATSSTYTIRSTATSDAGSYQVVVSNSAGTVTSNSATLTVNSSSGSGSSTPAPSALDVLTFHNDISRTGQDTNESTLTTSNVVSTGFGLVGSMNVDGHVDAEPLYVQGVTIGGASHNVVYVATENDSLYAFDADNYAQLWHQSLLGANESTPSTSDVFGCTQVSPQLGITATPVIDLSAGTHGTIFAVAMSKDTNGNFHQRFHALDLTTGAELNSGPTEIQATFPKSAGQTTFAPQQYEERAALLLLNGTVYLSWTSHCDDSPYTGWVMGYSESTLQQTTVIDVTPNGSEGAIWMAGDGPAADSSGNIYFLDANGSFDTTLTAGGFPNSGDYGNAFIKLSTSSGLAVADYFNMHNTVNESSNDQDLGSGGELLLPDLTDGSGTVHHLAVGAGKDGIIYVVNRDNMGKFNSGSDAIYQEISGALTGGVYSTPAYFNNTVYYGPVSSPVRAFPVSNAKLATSSTFQSSSSLGYPGGTPSVSANGTSNGIVWVVENGGTLGILHAYDATNLGHELYNSSQAGSRDQFTDGKFITPMVANGKVYVGTTSSVAVFGLL